MSDTATVQTWADMPVDHPLPDVDRRRIKGEYMNLAHVTVRAGLKLAVHQHVNEQFVHMVSGRMRFTIREGSEERLVELTAGQVLHLPSNVPHGAEVLEDAVVLDVFSPATDATGLDTAGGA